MKHGFIKTAAVTPRLKVADIKYNIGQIKNYMDKAEEYKINLVVFPELSVTGKTCGDLFYSQTVLSAAEKGIEKLCKYSKDKSNGTTKYQIYFAKILPRISSTEYLQLL